MSETTEFLRQMTAYRKKHNIAFACPIKLFCLFTISGPSSKLLVITWPRWQ